MSELSNLRYSLLMFVIIGTAIALIPYLTGVSFSPAFVIIGLWGLAGVVIGGVINLLIQSYGTENLGFVSVLTGSLLISFIVIICGIGTADAGGLIPDSGAVIATIITSGLGGLVGFDFTQSKKNTQSDDQTNATNTHRPPTYRYPTSRNRGRPDPAVGQTGRARRRE